MALGLALIAVRVVAGGVLRVALPILLSVFALAFGAGLRRAARRSEEAGRRLDGALGRALDQVRGVEPPSAHAQTRGQRAHVRVDSPERIDTSVLGEDPEDFEAHDRSSRSTR
ncbi:MAG: hypothetical protein QM756_47210 [Polyangiaceae bacterium]